eukprot:scaffold14535_cov198-Skeletonema_marinoi.AAC.3
MSTSTMPRSAGFCWCVAHAQPHKYLFPRTAKICTSGEISLPSTTTIHRLAGLSDASSFPSIT